MAHTLIVAGIVLAHNAALRISQTYDNEQAGSITRMGDGSGRKPDSWRKRRSVDQA